MEEIVEISDSDEEVIEISDSEEEDLESMLVEMTADEITVPGITVEELTNEEERDDGMEMQEEKEEKDRKNTVVKVTEEPGIRMREEDEEEPHRKEDKMTNLAAGVVGLIDAVVQEKLTTNGAHYKPRNIVEKVVGDIDKSLPMLS